MAEFQEVPPEEERLLSRGEELANATSHAVGIVAALVGAPVLLMAAANHRTLPFTIGTVVFVFTILVLYLGSTLYHAWPSTPVKSFLQVVDHSAIFLLIAGTYTPFTLGPLHGPRGWTILALIWTLALFGILLKARRGAKRHPKLGLSLYLGMGWLILLVILPLARAVPGATLFWLIGGGVTYTAGVVFFVRHRVRYNHFVWHLFVLGGTTCHFLALLSYAR